MKAFSPSLVALTVLFSLVNGALAQTNAKSEPAGFVTLQITPGFNAIGPALVNGSIFRSQITSSRLSTITFATGPTPLNLGARLQTGTRYYVEISRPSAKSADYLGDVLEVDVVATKATANNVLTVQGADFNTLATPLPNLSGYSAMIRPHLTIGQVFGKLGRILLKGARTPDLADQISFYDKSSGEFTGFWFYINSSTVVQWRSVDLADLKDYSDLPIPPGAGVLVERQASSPEKKIIFAGNVRTNDLRQPLTQGNNFVALGLPFAHSPALAGMNQAGGFLGTSSPSTADSMQILNPATGAYAKYWFRANTTGTVQQWRASDLANSSDYMNNTSFFDGTQAVFILKKSADPEYFLPISSLNLGR